MRTLTGCLLILGTTLPAYAADVSEFEKRRLFSPTAGELRAEASGRIYIYDGLRDVDIARAMDEAYERIEHMMFIRTRITDDAGEIARDPETGTALVEDDDC
jgi:hypothetical protein